MLIVTLLFLISANYVVAQKGGLPDVKLYDLNGSAISATEILNNGEAYILVYWKTHEKNCCEQINQMIEAHEKMAGLLQVKVVAVCVDCKGLTDHIKPFVSGKDWNIDVYIDKNGDLLRAMNIPSTPFTSVYDENQKLICQYSGYCAGAQEMVCETLKECLQISHK